MTNSGRPIEFGLFDWIDFETPEQVGARYRQRMRMLEYADQASFYCYHLAEHHLTSLSSTPSPAVFLAAVSQRTSRIRLGALVFLLTLYHPVRLAQEICMLDHLSGGRLDLGTGRGISPHELRLLGADAEDSRGMHDEAFKLILELLSSGKLSGSKGKHFTYDPLDIVMQPVQRPYPPLWYPVIDVDRARWVGSQGINTVTLLGANANTRALIEAYAEAFQGNLTSPDRLNAHVRQPKFGMVRQVYIAENHDDAMREARAAYEKHKRSFLYLWDFFGEAEHHAWLKDWDGQLKVGGLMVGTPSEIREQLLEQLDVTGANYFVTNFTFGDLTDEQVMRSIELFATEVMPHASATAATFTP
jgi:alkanesulfonate monooxygenase SsuD/methylene tetrahydromethanopterin reductase-like flavin-dependent oxidoreductase (luciferase family)